MRGYRASACASFFVLRNPLTDERSIAQNRHRNPNGIMLSTLVRAVLFALLMLVSPLIPAQTSVGDSYDSIVTPFFEDNCLRCHGPREVNGNLRVDRLSIDDFASTTRASRWKEILDAVNGHEMPPVDERQPDPDTLARFADWVLDRLIEAEKSSQSTRFVLRRLNSEEYNNTVRDLLHIDLMPADEFPEDGVAGGFDNNGSALTLSPLQLELYYDAALSALNRAIVTGSKPNAIHWRFDPERNTHGEDQMRVPRGGHDVLINPGNNRISGAWTILDRVDHDTEYGFREFAVPTEGVYTLRFRAFGDVPSRAEIVQRVTPLVIDHIHNWFDGKLRGSEFDRELERQLQRYRDDPMYNYGPGRIRITQSLGGTPTVVAEMDIEASSDNPRTYEIPLRFTTEEAGILIEPAYDIPGIPGHNHFQRNQEFPRPIVAIDWVEIEGPINEVWPPESHTKLLPDVPRRMSDEEEFAYVGNVLAQFMPRAYRRPVTDEEIEQKLHLYVAVREDKDSMYDAIKVPLAAVLTSPNFLYMVEHAAENGVTELDDYQFATRLSYFLWSSMPDEELFELASQGRLRDPVILSLQINRMLNDSRSAAFVRNFAGQWLGLRDVGANPPVINLYPHYDRHLAASVVKESEAFFAEVLQNDLDLRNFIRSDFVVVNERLARFYGIEGVHGDHFRRVPLPQGLPRGGIMTQSSILSLTSNGTRTSPVDRGVWVLSRMLGENPGLPVANVGEIAPVVPGIDKATVRQRLEAHRTMPQCARCHNRIDPLGFALENFDASGAWREREASGNHGLIFDSDPLIDSSSRMPDGTRIRGLEGLQNALLEREDQFFGSVTRSLLTYALGRTLTLTDERVVQNMVDSLDPENPTLRGLIQRIVFSEEFATR